MSAEELRILATKICDELQKKVLSHIAKGNIDSTTMLDVYLPISAKIICQKMVSDFKDHHS